MHFTFDKKGFLIFPDGKRVLRNPRTAGTPRYLKLSGNWFYASPNKFMRATAIKETKRFFRKELTKFGLSPLPRESYPLRIEWDLYFPIGEGNWDLDNLWFYQKCFLDVLVRMGIVEDDTVRYITSPARPQLIPVKDEEDRKFIFRIYKDDRECIINHEFWQEKVAA